MAKSWTERSQASAEIEINPVPVGIAGTPAEGL